jgi:hypothetical protein
MNDWLDTLPDSTQRESNKAHRVEQMNFNLDNAIKYVRRAGLEVGSPSISSLEKARWYIDREIQRKKIDLE